MTRNIDFESNFSLDFGAANETRVYGFVYEDYQNQVLKTQIFYEVEITFNDLGSHHIFEINRRSIYINNKLSHSQIEKIAETASDAVFPIRIKIKSDGQIDQILNQNDIRRRWSINRKKIFEYYKGEKVEKIILKIDRLFSNDNIFKELTTKNWFFHLFFKPLYVSYTDKLQTKYIWKSPVFGNQCIEYAAAQTVQKNYSEDDKIHINVDGISIDERTIDEIISGFNFPQSKFSELEEAFIESKMNVDYKLYKEDRSIFSVTGSFETKIKENTQKVIQLEIYHLTESSSYRPESDEKKKVFQKMFQSWQIEEEDDIIDVSKPKWQVPRASNLKIQKSPQEKIELFVGVGEDEKANHSFLGWIKSIFKKK